MFPEPNNSGTFDLCLPWRPLERWFVLPWPYTKNEANLTGTENRTHLIDFQTMFFFNCKDYSAFSDSDCKVRRYQYLISHDIIDISQKISNITISLLSRLQVVVQYSLLALIVGLFGTKSSNLHQRWPPAAFQCPFPSLLWSAPSAPGEENTNQRYSPENERLEPAKRWLEGDPFLLGR